ncbi:MAG: hypothetical protein ACTIJ6_00305 [Leucobacter sp.]
MHDQNNDSQSQKAPEHPTATAPPSVEESVYEEAEHVGKDGLDAADPPSAKNKQSDKDAPASGDAPTPLDPDEAADVAETREEAVEAKGKKGGEDRQDEDIISLDVPD